MSYIITHLIDEETWGRVGARQQVVDWEATEDVGEQLMRELFLSLAV